MTGICIAIKTFLYDVLVSITSESTKETLGRLLKIHLRSARRSYVNSIVSSTRAMPLIYRGLELSVERDFVPTRFVRLRLDMAANHKARNEGDGEVPSLMAINSLRRIVWLGDAGIGKTTLFRRTMLDLAARRHAHDALIKSEGLLPIYVPLKAVSDSEVSPIMRYVLRTVPYFSATSGKRRLLKLAQSGEIVLFLDGYDEIPYVGGAVQIRNELHVLFSDDPFADTRRELNSEYSELYQALQRCRIWVSSRREFYVDHPFGPSTSVSALAITGLPENGAILVGRVFSYYLEKEPRIFSDKLNSENFRSALYMTGDQSIIDLTKNPLFLTVLCYTYVETVRAGDDSQKLWSTGAFGVIQRCIRLLLREIDESKTEGLSRQDRAALLNRRSAWHDEKWKFLCFVAGESYKRSISILEKEQLYRFADEYFRDFSDSAECASILGGIRSREPAVDIVAQIRFSGVLPAVLNEDRQPVYDFPHRRFKETLAVEYLNEGGGVAFLCDNVTKDSLSELVLLFVEQTNHWYAICNSLISRIVSAVDEPQDTQAVFAKLLANIFERSKNRDEAARAAAHFVEACLTRGKYPVGPLRAIEALRGGHAESMGALVMNAINTAAVASDRDRLAFAIPVLHQVAREQYESIVCNMISKMTRIDRVFWVLVLAADIDGAVRLAAADLLFRAIGPKHSILSDEELTAAMKVIWAQGSTESRSAILKRAIKMLGPDATIVKEMTAYETARAKAKELDLKIPRADKELDAKERERREKIAAAERAVLDTINQAIPPNVPRYWR